MYLLDPSNIIAENWGQQKSRSKAGSSDSLAGGLTDILCHSLGAAAKGEIQLSLVIWEIEVIHEKPAGQYDP